MNQIDWKAEYEKLRDIEPPNERLRGGLKAVGRSYHDMAHNPDVPFVDCDEHMCVKVRALLRDTGGKCAYGDLCHYVATDDTPAWPDSRPRRVPQ